MLCLQILCAEPLFEDWFGRDPRGIMGKTLWSITAESDEMHAFVDRCEAAAAAGTFQDEEHLITTQLIHGYTGPVHVTIQARLAGALRHRLVTPLLMFRNHPMQMTNCWSAALAGGHTAAAVSCNYPVSQHV